MEILTRTGLHRTVLNIVASVEEVNITRIAAFSTKKYLYFSYFTSKAYVVGTH